MTLRTGLEVFEDYRARLKAGWRIEHDLNHDDPSKHYLALLSPDREQVSGFRREALFKLSPLDGDLVEIIARLICDDELEEDAEGLYHLPGQAEPTAAIIAFPPRKPGGPTP